MEKLNCTVESVVFRNEENGYTVLKVDADGSSVTAVGIFPILEPGERIELIGTFATHKKYGTQFKAESMEYSKAQTDEELIRFLSNGLFTGVGKVTAGRIVAYFGSSTFDVIEKDHAKLALVKGVSAKKAQAIHEEYIEKMAMRDAVMFLQSLEIGMGTALKIFNVYSLGTQDIVTENPYQLIEDIDGIGFFKADAIAKKLGIGEQSAFRVRAGVVHTLKEAEKQGGHTALPRELVVESVVGLIGLEDRELIESAIDTLIFGGSCTYYKRVTDDGDQEQLIALTKNYILENSIAAGLVKLQSRSKKLNLNVEEDIARYEREHNVSLHVNQRIAIREAINNGIAVVSGGPGTGKTTIVNCIVDIIKANKLKVELCAPTGRAAKRLSETTGLDARTIHRLLGFRFENGYSGFTFNDTNPLDTDVVIVDEISMADIFIFNALIKALPLGARLVLVGDCDQLPSVSAGNILADVIASELFSVNYLTFVYRQAERSHIISNAHRINNGEMPIIDNQSDDFYYFEVEDRDKQTDVIVDIVKNRVPSFKGVAVEDIQVLSPSKRGGAGVEMINVALQTALNPQGKEYAFAKPPRFRVGDKVMHVRNNYDKEWHRYNAVDDKGAGVFNGDMGYVHSVQGDTLAVLMEDGRLVEYDSEDVDELMLAYAVSVHKSQGSEFPVVVISITPGSPMLLTKNLLYTAVTRAKDVVVLVGDKKNIYRMVKNDYTEKRYTLLTDLLKRNLKKWEMLTCS